MSYDSNDNKKAFVTHPDSSLVDVNWLQAQETHGVVGEAKVLIHNFKRSYQVRRATYTWVDWLAFFLPCVRWLRTYDVKRHLLADFVAGISVGFMVVPQGLGYANTARLPAVYGLYGAFLPCLAYALVGSSKQLAVGPVAVTSLLIGTALQDIVPESKAITNFNAPTPEQAPWQELANHKAIQLAFLVALMYTGLGVLRLGFVTNFLSHSIIGGFTSGAAITIGLSQFKYIVGFAVKPSAERIHLYVHDYIHGMHDIQWQEFIMSCFIIAMLLWFREIGKVVPRLKWLKPFGPLAACIVGLVTVYGGGVDKLGIRIISAIPKGLPKPTVHWWFPMEDSGKLLQTAVVVCLVDLLESTSIARALAAKHKYELDFNLEVTGLGIANFVGACFNCYTTTGSFSRSSVNNESGAKSPLAQFVCAWVVAFVLIFLTPVFENLPYNILGCIVVVAVSALFEYEQAIYLFRHNAIDFICWLSSFLGVIFASIEIGLAIAIGVSALTIFFRSAFPNKYMLGAMPGTRVYKDITQEPAAQLMPGILIVGMDAPMYFANIQGFKDFLFRKKASISAWSAERGAKLEYIIIDLAGANYIDANASSLFLKLTDSLSRDGIQLVLAGPNNGVLRTLERAKVPEVIGRDWVFVTLHDAVLYVQSRQAERGMLKEPEAFKDVPDAWVVI